MVQWDRVAREDRWHQEEALEDPVDQDPTTLVQEDPWEDQGDLEALVGREHQWDLVDRCRLVDQWDLGALVGQEGKAHQWDQVDRWDPVDRWGLKDLGDRWDQEDQEHLQATE
jgi:hypothetical protein